MIHSMSGTLAGPMVDEEHIRDLVGWDQTVADNKYIIQTHLCVEFIERRVEGTWWGGGQSACLSLPKNRTEGVGVSKVCLLKGPLYLCTD